MLKIVKINHNELENYKDAWQELLLKSKIDNIFLTHDWISLCIRHFFMPQDLLILTVFSGDTLVGIAPLMIKKYKYFGLPVKSVCFIGTTISDRMDFILHGNKEEIIELIMGYLMKIKNKWDFVDLEELSSQTGTVKAVETYLAGNHIINMLGPSKKSFYITMDNAEGDISREFLKKFHRKLRKVNNRYPGLNLSFKRYAGDEVLEDNVFSEVSALENRSWKGDERSGIFSKFSSTGFHREVFSKFSENGLIDLSVLNLDARPIAYIYNYLYGKRAYCYNIAYDKKYANLSPGTLLILWTLHDSSLRDIVEFDFARGEGDWKSRFTKDFRLHDRIRIFKNTAYSRFLYYLQSKVMPYMRKRKSIYNLWMKLKGWLKWE